MAGTAGPVGPAVAVIARRAHPAVVAIAVRQVEAVVVAVAPVADRAAVVIQRRRTLRAPVRGTDIVPRHIPKRKTDWFSSRGERYGNLQSFHRAERAVIAFH